MIEISGNMHNEADESSLGLVWWNVNDFHHFRPEEVKKGADTRSRWPQSRDEYQQKCRRVDAALTELFDLVGLPSVVALGEITKVAATELRDRLLPTYRLASLDVAMHQPTLQVAVLFAPDSSRMQFNEAPPIVVPNTARGTRPMAVLDARVEDHTVRIIACHWQARMDEDGSRRARYRTADYLAVQSFAFLNKGAGKHHLAIIGDLNDEPYEESLKTLNAHRHRGRAQGRLHWTDTDVSRVHLYNTSWRLLGENHPHPTVGTTLTMESCAGTYYWESEREWRHFDHLIVSGGLLGDVRPFLDETEVSVISTPAFLSGGLPLKFSRDGPKYRGVSDHLPLFAKILT